MLAAEVASLGNVRGEQSLPNIIAIAGTKEIRADVTLS